MKKFKNIPKCFKKLHPLTTSTSKPLSIEIILANEVTLYPSVLRMYADIEICKDIKFFSNIPSGTITNS